MKCAVMQPTYIPWPGFFNLIVNSDAFIFLDDVQFEHQSWQTRNRVSNHGNEILLSVPIKKHSLDTKIFDVKVTGDQKWRKKHVKTIMHAYSNTPFFSNVFPFYEEIIQNSSVELLSDLNIRLIEMFTKKLNIECDFLLASELGCSGVRSEHVQQICKKVGASDYISPRGAQSYIEEDNVLIDCEINVQFQSFDMKPYSQSGSKKFVSHMSIIDLVMNLGWDEAKRYITEGWVAE